MIELTPMAEAVAALLKDRGETIAVSESSTGGLISAALLAVPGASAYFVGGGAIYTETARLGLLGIDLAGHPGMRASTEAYAALSAATIRARLAATWGLGESGASGPTGNRYGDAAGHCCIAIAGPIAQAITIETGSNAREANMWLFTKKALVLLEQVLARAPITKI